MEQLKKTDTPAILSFWHNQIFYATHFWRFRNISVITSPHGDGDYIAHIIERFGYVAARGSSTRGSARALLELRRHLRKGGDVRIHNRWPDRSRVPGQTWSRSGYLRKQVIPLSPSTSSPRVSGKPGAGTDFGIPRPFSPALVKIGPPFTVPPDDSGEDWIHTYQQSMDVLKEYCEAYDWEGFEVGSRRSL